MPFTFTASSVLASSVAPKTAIAAVALSAGELIYLDSATSNQARKSVNSSLAAAACVGMALNSCAAGQPVSYTDAGEITVQTAAFGSTGIVLVISSTAGQCESVADMSQGDYLTMIGFSVAGNKFRFDLNQTGYQLAGV